MQAKCTRSQQKHLFIATILRYHKILIDTWG